MATVQDQPHLGTDGHESDVARRTMPRSPREAEALTEPEVRRSAAFVVAGFSGEALAAAGAVVLAIIGLSGVVPLAMAPIIAIIISAALLLKSASVISRFRDLEWETGGTPGAITELRAGMLMEFLASGAGIALAVLAWSGIVPLVLLPIAAIAFGGALLLGSGETYRVSRLASQQERVSEAMHYFARSTAKSASGAEMLVGLAAIALGVIALCGVAALTLTLVAFLSVAGAQLLIGLAESGRMTALLRS